MVKKIKVKKEEKNVVEVHIYIHHVPQLNMPFTPNTQPVPYNPITNPPWTCGPRATC